MSKQSSIRLGQIKNQFSRLPLPDKFSRIVTVLLGYTSRDTYLCWPSKRRIAQQVGCSEKTVARNLKAAEQIGLFRVRTLGRSEMTAKLGDRFKPGASGQRLYNLYALNGDHPLWSGNQLEAAKKIIRECTYAGVDQRGKGSQGPNQESSLPDRQGPVLLPLEMTPKSAQIGTGPSHQIGTGSSG